MDYEKKYKALLKQAKEELKTCGSLDCDAAKQIFRFFPELAESDDERIRKAIIDFLWEEKIFLQDVNSSVENNPKYRFVMDAINWLEKQGKQKPIEVVNGEDYGIDSLWHAQRILEKTLGEVEGYQTDDGLLEHKAAITAVKKLREQEPAWSDEDEERYLSCLPKLGTGNIEQPDTINTMWLKSLKNRVQSIAKFVGELQYNKGFGDGVSKVLQNPKEYGLTPPF